jgi:hypothetical protein
LLLVAIAGPSVAWDTKEDPSGLTWRGAYLDEQGGANEHTTIASETFLMMGLPQFAVSKENDANADIFRVVDWNASYFRSHVLDASDTVGDVFSTVYEERALPAPAYFAGMPDYNWTIYDWINKSALCPTIPETSIHTLLLDGLSDDPCHAFKGWFGALNANHFGTQARRTYFQAHSTALALAAHAAEMRVMLEAAPGEYEHYREYVREAELEALLYESYAQHYLQDRWSSGHMWERWNAGDFAQLPDTRGDVNMVVAAVSGIIHGAEGLTSRADPMCSPIIDEGIVVPTLWGQPNQTLLDGVGDYRFAENLTGSPIGFGTFEGISYDVRPQLNAMFECSMRGWAEVIRAFPQNDDGSYGAWELALSSSVPTGSVEADECWYQWATNASILAGMGSEVFSLATIARSAITFGGGVLPDVNRDALRVDMVDIHWRLWDTARRNPNGTGAAQGAFPALLGAQPGNFYGVASWLEPTDVDTLPLIDGVTGRDRRAVHGFFNRSHAEEFCDADLFGSTIAGMRGSNDPIDQAFCRYFAERVYRGTDPAYEGENVETLTTGAVSGTPDPVAIRPICHHYGLMESGDSDESLPYYVHSGYVSDPGLIVTSVAPGGGDTGTGHATVAHWCDQVPVVDVDNRTDIAATVNYDSDEVTLTGLNFGPAGTITVGWRGQIFDLSNVSWSDTSVTVRLPGDLSGTTGDLPDGSWLWHIFVETGHTPPRDSVGRAYLRVLPWSSDAPIVNDVRWTPAKVVPGDMANVEVDVFDAEGVEDLGGTTSVTLNSPVLDLNLKVFTVADNPMDAGGIRTFSSMEQIKRPLNDRSSMCMPAEWPLDATATDDALYPPTMPVALTGPRFDDTVAVDNVAPAVDCGFDDQKVYTAGPGDELAPLELAVRDDNNDGLAGCEELPPANVEIVSVTPGGLLTSPDLTGASFAVTSGPTMEGTTGFSSQVITIRNPHPDNDDPMDDPYVVTLMASDDDGKDIGGPNRDCPGATPQATLLIRVENRMPSVLSGTVNPSALHPLESTQVQLEVSVDDPNTYDDVVAVTADASDLGGPADVALNNDGTGKWSAIFYVSAPADGPRNIVITATDDDAVDSMPFNVSVPIEDLPPAWQGGGFLTNLDPPDGDPSTGPNDGYVLYECDPLRIGTIFDEPNGDALNVICIIEGNGQRIELPMQNPDGNNTWTVDTTAPSAGSYTISFKATEIGGPPPALSTTAECCPMEVLPRPEGCDEFRVCGFDGSLVLVGAGAGQPTVNAEGYAAWVEGPPTELGTRTLVVADLCSATQWSVALPNSAFVSGTPQLGDGVVYWSDDRAGRNDYRLFSWRYDDAGAQPTRLLVAETVQVQPRLGDGVLAWVEDVSGVGREIHAAELTSGVLGTPALASDAPTAEFVDVRFAADDGRVVWLDDSNVLHVAEAPAFADQTATLARAFTNTLDLDLDGTSVFADDYDTDTGRFEIFSASLVDGAVDRIAPGASGRFRPDGDQGLLVFEEVIGLFGPEQKIVFDNPAAAPAQTDLTGTTKTARNPSMAGPFVVFEIDGEGVYSVQLP